MPFQKIWQWNGQHSNHAERRKADELTKTINIERDCKCDIEYIGSTALFLATNIAWQLSDQTPPKLPTDELEDAPKFWAKFGGKPKSIAPETTDEGVKCADRLYKLSNEKGSLTMTLVGEGELDSKMLDTNDIFLLDAGFQIYTWVGKNANSEEKAAAMT